MNHSKPIPFVCILMVVTLVGNAGDAAHVLPTTNFERAEKYEAHPAGAATHYKIAGADSFSFPSNNMSFERQLSFTIGNRLFTRNWVSSPSSTKSNDGLGPLFNARSCQACHFKDGRGHLPTSKADDAISLIVKLSVPSEKDKGKFASSDEGSIAVPDPVYGSQLQDFAVQGLHPEGTIDVTFTKSIIRLGDSSQVELRKPIVNIGRLNYGALHKDVLISPRIAPQMIGLGLLENVKEGDILQYADESDADENGVSGRPHYVDSRLLGEETIGRFGWKASKATLREQVEQAFVIDIGLTTPLHMNELDNSALPNSENTSDSSAYYSLNEAIEIDEELINFVTFYSRNLAVPQRRHADSKEVLKGKQIFYEIGCATCHRPKFITQSSEIHVEQSRQLIWPYTDLLLHDMGEGLADGRVEGSASGREWRTPPLWGIGLTSLVNEESGYLHDGRARNVLEAILWHGGESYAVIEKFKKLSSNQRKELLLFVKSL